MAAPTNTGRSRGTARELLHDKDAARPPQTGRAHDPGGHMQTSRAAGRKWAVAPMLVAVVVAIALAVVIAIALSACGGGGGGVAGAYKFDSGSQQTLAKFKLTLNDDKTFKLAGPNPLGGAEVSVGGTYALDGDKITLKGKSGDKFEAGTVQGQKLVFKDVTWVKE
jgi:hypothetical protein